MSQIKYVFIDESGDLGMRGSAYFIMAMIIIDDEHPLKRIVNNVRKRKLKKKKRDVKELKANKSSDDIREYVLKKISELDCEIYVIVVEKSKIMSHFYKMKNIFYNFVSRILLTEGKLSNNILHIIIDKKYTNTLLIDNFNTYIKREVENRKIGVKIKDIVHGNSEAYPGLQCVDFVAWAVSRKFNYGDDRFYKIIEKKIMNRRRMKLWEN